jgi:hypothetical protein
MNKSTCSNGTEDHQMLKQWNRWEDPEMLKCWYLIQA